MVTGEVEIQKRVLSDREKGLKINGVTLNNLRFADDIVVLANNIA